MKKLFLLATAALLVTSVTFADNGKNKSKKKGKGKAACCSHSGKSCCKDKETTVKM